MGDNSARIELVSLLGRYTSDNDREAFVPMPDSRNIPVELPKDGPTIGPVCCYYCGSDGRLGTRCENCGASLWTGTAHRRARKRTAPKQHPPKPVPDPIQYQRE